MPRNNEGYEEDAQGQTRDQEGNDQPLHVPKEDGADENSALQEVHTYFSEEKVLIPETEQVCTKKERALSLIGLWNRQASSEYLWVDRRHVDPTRSYCTVRSTDWSSIVD